MFVSYLYDDLFSFRPSRGYATVHFWKLCFLDLESTLLHYTSCLYIARTTRRYFSKSWKMKKVGYLQVELFSFLTNGNLHFHFFALNQLCTAAHGNMNINLEDLSQIVSIP